MDTLLATGGSCKRSKGPWSYKGVRCSSGSEFCNFAGHYNLKFANGFVVKVTVSGNGNVKTESEEAPLTGMGKPSTHPKCPTGKPCLLVKGIYKGASTFDLFSLSGDEITDFHFRGKTDYCCTAVGRKVPGSEKDQGCGGGLSFASGVGGTDSSSPAVPVDRSSDSSLLLEKTGSPSSSSSSSSVEIGADGSTSTVPASTVPDQAEAPSRKKPPDRPGPAEEVAAAPVPIDQNSPRPEVISKPNKEPPAALLGAAPKVAPNSTTTTISAAAATTPPPANANAKSAPQLLARKETAELPNSQQPKADSDTPVSSPPDEMGAQSAFAEGDAPAQVSKEEENLGDEDPEDDPDDADKKKAEGKIHKDQMAAFGVKDAHLFRSAGGSLAQGKTSELPPRSTTSRRENVVHNLHRGGAIPAVGGQTGGPGTGSSDHASESSSALSFLQLGSTTVRLTMAGIFLPVVRGAASTTSQHHGHGTIRTAKSHLLLSTNALSKSRTHLDKPHTVYDHTGSLDYVVDSLKADDQRAKRAIAWNDKIKSQHADQNDQQEKAAADTVEKLKQFRTEAKTRRLRELHERSEKRKERIEKWKKGLFVPEAKKNGPKEPGNNFWRPGEQPKETQELPPPLDWSKRHIEDKTIYRKSKFSQPGAMGRVDPSFVAPVLPYWAANDTAKKGGGASARVKSNPLRLFGSNGIGLVEGKKKMADGHFLFHRREAGGDVTERGPGRRRAGKRGRKRTGSRTHVSSRPHATSALLEEHEHSGAAHLHAAAEVHKLQEHHQDPSPSEVPRDQWDLDHYLAENEKDAQSAVSELAKQTGVSESGIQAASTVTSDGAPKSHASGGGVEYEDNDEEDEDEENQDPATQEDIEGATESETAFIAEHGAAGPAGNHWENFWTNFNVGDMAAGAKAVGVSPVGGGGSSASPASGAASSSPAASPSSSTPRKFNWGSVQWKGGHSTTHTTAGSVWGKSGGAGGSTTAGSPSGVSGAWAAPAPDPNAADVGLNLPKKEGISVEFKQNMAASNNIQTDIFGPGGGYDVHQGWPQNTGLLSAQTTGIDEATCRGMVPSGGGYYYDSKTSGGWCKTITAANVEAVREAVTTSWNAGHGSYTNTYLPRGKVSHFIGPIPRFSFVCCSYVVEDPSGSLFTTSAIMRVQPGVAAAS